MNLLAPRHAHPVLPMLSEEYVVGPPRLPSCWLCTQSRSWHLRRWRLGFTYRLWPTRWPIQVSLGTEGRWIVECRVSGSHLTVVFKVQGNRYCAPFTVSPLYCIYCWIIIQDVLSVCSFNELTIYPLELHRKPEDALPLIQYLCNRVIMSSAVWAVQTSESTADHK